MMTLTVCPTRLMGRADELGADISDMIMLGKY
jgi:hypothetical protein